MGVLRSLATLALAIGMVGGGSTRRLVLSDVRYEVTVDSAAAGEGTLGVTMRFGVADASPVLLSLPAWTPGDYEIRNFARNVMGFSATEGDQAIRWDKADPDTWRVFPEGVGQIVVHFDYLADELICSTAWAGPDLAFFNGTNLFLYPENASEVGTAHVSIRANRDWDVATGLHSTGVPHEFEARTYDELVDNPFVVGHLQIDSVEVQGRILRLATYPVGAVDGTVREGLWRSITSSLPLMGRLFGETPFSSYTAMVLFPEGVPGGSALEHESSFLGVLSPDLIGDPSLLQITLHEIFHAWNVKRLRPAEMVPYDYSRSQPTQLLWFSEGLTDYYADLMVARSGTGTPEDFYAAVLRKIDAVGDAPAVALEDASLSAWIQPRDGTGESYYDKGSLAALLLDIEIRDASDNRASLDDVIRDLYETSYKEGNAFTPQALWHAVDRAVGSGVLAKFNARYVDGREQYPWADVLPMAGLRIVSDTMSVPTFAPASLGLNTGTGNIFVQSVGDGGALQAAGIEPGDTLVSLGDVTVTGVPSLQEFRDHYQGASEGTLVEVVVRRGDTTLTRQMPLKMTDRVARSIREIPNASAKAKRIRNGILGK